MPVYRTLIDSDWDQFGPSTMTIHEEDRAPVRTGVLDASGQMIFRMPDTVQCGFHPSGVPMKKKPGKKRPGC